MAVIALTSASGSPGVTTTAVGLALLWPRPVILVEADPTGGSGLLAGYFRGTRPYTTGLIELALSPEPVADALPSAVIPIDGTSVSFVAGTRSHAQAGALQDLWEPLAEAFAGLDENGQDVIVDVGRRGLVGSPELLLNRADLSLLVARTNLPSLVAARSWTAGWRHDAQPMRHVGLLTVGEGQPYSSREVTDVLGLPVVASVHDDPVAAAVFHRGAEPGRAFESGGLVRSLRSAIAAIQHVIAEPNIGLLSEVAR